MNIYSLINRLSPAVTDRVQPCGNIRYYAQGDVTCYILKGTHGDLLIDTGFLHTKGGLLQWLTQFQVRHVLLTHAHADHDWNAAALQRDGAVIMLSERDRNLRQNYLSQPVKPTAPKYRLRNRIQLIEGAVFHSPAYEADIYFTDNDTGLLRTLGYPADIIPLPGHTFGSVGVWSGGVLYCGDAFTGLWKKPDVTPHAVCPKLMRRSLKTIMRLSPEWLACGHGLPMRFSEAEPVIRDVLDRKANL